MTLDTYGHLFEDRLDEVGSAMDAARTAARERRAHLRALPRVAPVLPRPGSGLESGEVRKRVSAGQEGISTVHPQRD